MTNSSFILETISQLQDPNKENLHRLYQDIINEVPTARGSSNNKHQWREWWYYDHIADILKFGKKMYDVLHSYRPLPFSFDDVVVVILIHDIEKPYKYSTNNQKYNDILTLDNHGIRDEIIHRYNIIFSPEQQNGIDYIHGEWDEYSKTERIMWPLAAFCHSLDVISARIYFNDGQTH